MATFEYHPSMPAGIELAWDGEQKVWGQTRCTLESPLYSRHELALDAGGFCSFHWHRHRANRFFVQSGLVRIVWAYGWQINAVELGSDNEFDIPSLVPHQFQVLIGGVMIEEYHADRGEGKVDNADIVRLTEGGRVAPELLATGRGPAVCLKDGSLWRGR